MKFLIILGKLIGCIAFLYAVAHFWASTGSKIKYKGWGGRRRW